MLRSVFIIWKSRDGGTAQVLVSHGAFTSREDAEHIARDLNDGTGDGECSYDVTDLDLTQHADYSPEREEARIKELEERLSKIALIAVGHDK